MGKFEERSPGKGPMYVGSYSMGDEIDYHTPEVGDIALIRFEGITILTKLTKVELPALTAKIFGFENYHKEELDNMKEGTVIDFEEKNVFGFNQGS